jgi:Integrase
MSRDSIEARFMRSAQRHSGYATKTKSRMRTTYRAMSATAQAGRWEECSPSTLTEKQLTRFVEARRVQVSARSVQNEMSHLRAALRGAGRADFAAQMTNAHLGVPAGTRKGTGKEVVADVYAQALARANAATRVYIELQRGLGLRLDELVQSHKDLKVWAKHLEAGRSFVTIRSGTKGGRIRDTHLTPAGRARALEAVRQAIALASTRPTGYLVDSVNGKAATKQVGERYARIGLTGDNSSHALRRAFAIENFRHYRAEGYGEARALALVSRDLGHGDGRGRWIFNNYGLAYV